MMKTLLNKSSWLSPPCCSSCVRSPSRCWRVSAPSAVVAQGANGNWLLVALAIGGVLVSSWHGLMKHSGSLMV